MHEEESATQKRCDNLHPIRRNVRRRNKRLLFSPERCESPGLKLTQGGGVETRSTPLRTLHTSEEEEEEKRRRRRRRRNKG